MQRITVGNLELDVVKKDIKNLHLGVYPPNGRVRVAAPLSMDDEAIRLFIISKLTWIKKQQAKFASQDRQSEREYVSGESHYVSGTRYLLNVIYGKTKPGVVIRNKTYIDLYVRESSTQEQRAKVMMEWYRQRLKLQIPKLIAKWEKKIGVKVAAWGVKQMKTKWGSCNILEKRIWLNLELAKKPIHCLEYVIVHELVHLLERLHNDRFVAYMDKFMPQWSIYKDELNNFVLDDTNWEPQQQH
ncbi:M48 family metallopeptidase [Shimazuella kribbensis]|uniref:M48 family metallopeptidase n=1 Tax=Shimazuella kribbensis TaxID=139808 RepID=UPI000410FC7F|nr:SprT family zinc-dependent metalloprotease [Shimazuella kribbensis]